MKSYVLNLIYDTFIGILEDGQAIEQGLVGIKKPPSKKLSGFFNTINNQLNSH